MSTESLKVTDVLINPELGLARCPLPRPTLGPGPGSPHPWDQGAICPWAPLRGLCPVWCGERGHQLFLCHWGFLRACKTMLHPGSLPGHLRGGVSVWVRERSRSLPCSQSLLHQQHSLCTGGISFCLSVHKHTVLSWRENDYKKVPSLRHFYCILVMWSFSKLHALLYI